MSLKRILENLPEVKGPAEKKLGFNVKLKWTLIILASYFVLANIPLFGLASNSLSRFEFLAIILGTQFGSVISLGIGPIVMASIILQLLVGSKMLNINMSSSEGKKTFQGLQKILIIFFCIFEATIYVLMKGLEAGPGFTGILIFQLFLGGILIMFMDEVISKWGFGSGVSLFIAAGVGWQLFTTAFGFLGPQNTISAVGRVWTFFASLSAGDTINATVAATAILATILVFLVVVWAQAIKVEIPLSFGRIRGFGMRWPLAFFYTSNIPVILTAALLANVQLFGTLLENWLGISAASVTAFVNPPNVVENLIRGSFSGGMFFQSLVYMALMVAGSIMFAIFWVKTSGMDASNVSNQILSSGLQIPGFRRDPRVLETVLNRYIMPLTIMGGAAVGLLAASADLVGALVRGTGLLLGVMIVYKLYEEIAQQHAYDMYPALRKIMVK
ncbi:preprotein translocase subunit SecY [Nanoarchaeota archaeon]